VVQSRYHTSFFPREAPAWSEPTIAQTVLFPDLADRPLVATFDQPHASSDGGAILFQAADRHLGPLGALAATVPDARDPARVTQAVGDLVAQRVVAIACGHPDGNDAAASLAGAGEPGRSRKRAKNNTKIVVGTLARRRNAKVTSIAAASAQGAIALARSSVGRF
jgi:hypothetical protein